MSSATVRGAVASYFESRAIPGLNQVYLAQPWYIDGSAWNLDDNLGSGAVAFIHLAQDTEHRITLPAYTGSKGVEYTIGVVVLYQYLLKSAAALPVSPDDWVGPLDATLDGIKDVIRADATFGAPDVIFEAGQKAGGITITRDLPRRVSGKVLSWNVVEFGLTEIIES